MGFFINAWIVFFIILMLYFYDFLIQGKIIKTKLLLKFSLLAFCSILCFLPFKTHSLLLACFTFLLIPLLAKYFIKPFLQFPYQLFTLSIAPIILFSLSYYVLNPQQDIWIRTILACISFGFMALFLIYGVFSTFIKKEKFFSLQDWLIILWITSTYSTMFWNEITLFDGIITKAIITPFDIEKFNVFCLFATLTIFIHLCIVITLFVRFKQFLAKTKTQKFHSSK